MRTLSASSWWTGGEPHRWVRRMVAITAIGAGLWIIVSTVFVRTWQDPDRTPTPDRSAVFRQVVADLEAGGVLLRPPVKASLNELISWWVKRPDLQRNFHDASGHPDVQRLLDWAGGANDSSAIGLLDDRGNLEELAGRMGILPADGDVLSPLTWTVRNRRRPTIVAEGVIWRVREVWQERPDIRQHFTVDGRVNVRGLLFWAATVPRTDSSYPQLVDVSSNLERLLGDLDLG